MADFHLKKKPAWRRVHFWFWLFLVLPAAFVTYAWASISISERQTRALAEQIRLVYGLPRSQYQFPIHYFGEVVRDGMRSDEVGIAISPIRNLVKRISWHSELSRTGKRWVAERVLLEVPWAPDYPVDIFFRDGRVSDLDSGYYISAQNEISADSAARLLD
jgi:hypothetical protein